MPTSFSLKDDSWRDTVSSLVEAHQDIDLQQLVRIDVGNMEGDLLCIPEDISTIAILLADAEDKLLEAKQTVSDCYAELYKHYKETYVSTDGKKPTIEDLKNTVYGDDSYKAFLTQQNRCILLVEIIKGVKASLETKGRILRDACNRDSSKLLADDK